MISMLLDSVLVSVSAASSRLSATCSVVFSVVTDSAVASSGSVACMIGGFFGIMASVVSSGARVLVASSCAAFFCALAAAFSARVTFALGSENVSGSTSDMLMGEAGIYFGFHVCCGGGAKSFLFGNLSYYWVADRQAGAFFPEAGGIIRDYGAGWFPRRHLKGGW